MAYDPSDGMETVEELKKYVRFLYGMNQEKDKRILKMEKDMSEIKDEVLDAYVYSTIILILWQYVSIILYPFSGI